VENDRSVWGYIKSDGTWLVKPQFERADSFADDEAYCCKNCSSKSTKEEFWINKDGTIEKHTRHLIPIALPDLSSSKEKSSQ
jgi:hypothetical protein